MFPLILAALAVLPAILGQSLEGAQAGLERVKAQYRDTTLRNLGPNCRQEDLIVRREWGNASPEERQDYIRATRCLYNSPGFTLQTFAPGARNRRDDFIVPHIFFQAKYHFSPWTLAFHSWYIWLYEQALKQECGYKGGLLYMGYEKYGYQDFEYTPLFDGSPTSLGGDGVLSPDGCYCNQGPFSDFICNLGPIAGGGGCRQNPQPDGLGYNPRCLERHFNRTVLADLTYQNVYETIVGFDDISNFCLRIEHWPGGLHSTPHTAVGGTQDDIPGSPCDPWFFEHHAGLDFYWKLWTSIDPPGRTFAFSNPEQYNKERHNRGWQDADTVTPDSYLDMGPVLPGTIIGDIMSSTNGPMCYIYE